MRTLLALTLTTALALGPVGCHTTIGHPDGYEDDFEAHEVRARVAVLRFTDRRPQEEVFRPREFLVWWDFTVDGWWDAADVAAAVSEEVARRLRTSGLYAQVDYVAIPSESFGPEVARSLRDRGYDAALCGEILHFHGMRRQDLARGGLLSLLGPVGSGAGFLMGHQARGLTALDDVRLVRSTDGAVMWEGEAKGEVTDSSYLLEDAGTYANRSLDAAIEDLRARLNAEAPRIARDLGSEVREADTAPRGAEGGTSLVLVPLEAGVDGVKSLGKQAGKALDSVVDALLDLF